MAATMVRPSGHRAPPRAVHLRVVGFAEPSVMAKRVPLRPTWWALHGTAVLTVGGVFAAEAILPEGLARTLTELLAVLSGVGLIRLWLVCNRWRLVQAEKQDNPATLDQGVEGSSMQEVRR